MSITKRCGYKVKFITQQQKSWQPPLPSLTKFHWSLGKDLPQSKQLLSWSFPAMCLSKIRDRLSETLSTLLSLHPCFCPFGCPAQRYSLAMAVPLAHNLQQSQLAADDPAISTPALSESSLLPPIQARYLSATTQSSSHPHCPPRSQPCLPCTPTVFFLPLLMRCTQPVPICMTQLLAATGLLLKATYTILMMLWKASGTF